VAPHAAKYVHAVPPAEATGLVAEVYEQLARDFQIVSPIIVHSPAPRLLAAVWCVLRETLVAGRVSRAHKEAWPLACHGPMPVRTASPCMP
jgi:hypothetical protein